MKKIIITILMMLVLVLGSGCEEYQKSERDVDEMIEEIKQAGYQTLGEEKMREIWGDDEKKKISTPCIEITANGASEGKLFQFNITLKNNCSSRVFVYSSNFTLSMPGGLTINPTLESVNSFKGIELNKGEKTQGVIEFIHKEEIKPGIYYLNFNHREGTQEFAFRKE